MEGFSAVDHLSHAVVTDHSDVAENTTYTPMPDRSTGDIWSRKTG